MLCQCTTHVQTGGCHSFAERKTAYMYRFPIHIDRMCSLKLFLNVSISTTSGWGCSLVAGASDRHADGAGWIPRCGKGFFSQSRLSVQTLLRCRTRPCAIACIYICMHVKDPVVHQSSEDYGNTKTPSMHPRLGSATLSQLAFPGEGNPNFPWEKSLGDNTVVKSKKVVLLVKRNVSMNECV